MEEKKNKKLKVLIIVGIVLVLVSGVTLAYFMSRRTGTPTTVEAKDLAITYTGESKFNIDSKIDPIMESEILTSAPKVEFTVENTGEDNVYLQFDIVDITLNKFKDYDFKWALYQEDGKISTGSFIAEEDGKVTLAAGKELAPSTPTTYQVYVWINETTKDQSEMMAGTFTGTVQVTGYGKDNTLAGKILTSGTKYITKTTYEYIGCDSGCVEANSEEFCYNINYCSGRNAISSEYSELDKTIYTIPTFTTTSTDRGLFVQQGDSTKSDFGFPTYYYRGQNENNYVSFGIYQSSDSHLTPIVSQGYKKGDPIIWRIVRINEDGSIRLMSEYLSASADITYTGSTIESTINAWYESNIGSNSGTTLDNLVQTGNFCNDISGNYNAANIRIENNNPTFTCPNDGVMINSKAGIITADEVIYSGALYNESVADNLTYLHANAPFITITPDSNETSFYWWTNLQMYLEDIDSANGGLRAVINLKPDVTIKSGDGTSTSPYVIG